MDVSRADKQCMSKVQRSKAMVYKFKSIVLLSLQSGCGGVVRKMLLALLPVGR